MAKTDRVLLLLEALQDSRTELRTSVHALADRLRAT
jgi:hypothetical protein